MKIVMIHTSPVSLNELKSLCKEYLPSVELVNIIDDSLLDEVKKNNGITPAIVSRMCTYIQTAQTLHADIIFNQCSSVGEAFDIAKQCTNLKTLKIDEAMAEHAVSKGVKIGVIATVASTMLPSCNLIKTKAKEVGKEVHIKEYLVANALDILMKENDVEKHNELILEQIHIAEKENDVIVLAQGSMTSLIPYVKDMEVEVLTSPRLAVEKLRKMVDEMEAD